MKLLTRESILLLTFPLITYTVMFRIKESCGHLSVPLLNMVSTFLVDINVSIRLHTSCYGTSNILYICHILKNTGSSCYALGTNAVTAGDRIYLLNASDFQRPKRRICASEKPFVAAYDAPPIRKLCPL